MFRSRHACLVLFALFILGARGGAWAGIAESLRIFTRGQTVSFTIPAATATVWTVTDAEGSKAAEGAISAGATTVTLPVRQVGYYELLIASAAPVPFAIIFPRPSSPDPDSPFAIDGHIIDIYFAGLNAGTELTKDREFRTNLELVRLSGAVWLRDRLRWDWVESTEGQWTWSQFDGRVNKVGQAGLRLVPAVEGNSSWSESGTTKTGFGPPRVDAWRALWTQLASRYAGKITHWQVWNEPNPAGIAGARYPGGITAEKFRDNFLKPAWEAAKAANPDVKMVLGGSAGIDPPWTQALYTSESWRWFDVFDWHPYATTPRNYRTQALILPPLFQTAGRPATPVWGTEFEVKTPDDLAQWYVTIMALREKVNMGPHFIFDLKDWPGEGPYSYKMGLVRENGTPKDKFVAFNIGATLLDRAKFAGSLNLAEDVIAYRFSRPSASREKAWLETPAPTPNPAPAPSLKKKSALEPAAAGPLTVLWNEGRERVVSLRVGQPSVSVMGAAGPERAPEHFMAAPG